MMAPRRGLRGRVASPLSSGDQDPPTAIFPVRAMRVPAATVSALPGRILTDWPSSAEGDGTIRRLYRLLGMLGEVKQNCRRSG